VRRGKIKALNIEKNDYTPVFNTMDNSFDIQEDFKFLKQFVCILYMKDKYSDINKLRVDIFRQKF
jgi:hypothetical protein